MIGDEVMEVHSVVEKNPFLVELSHGTHGMGWNSMNQLVPGDDFFVPFHSEA